MGRIYVPSTPATRGEVDGAQRGETNQASGLTVEQLELAAAAAGYQLVKVEPEATLEEPAGNAARDDWADFAKSKGATDADLVDKDGKALTRDALREKYGTPAPAGA
jgi:hypothetical protein